MRQLIAYAMSALVLGAVAYAFAPRSPTALPATVLHVERMQINDLSVQQEKIIAVGERGSILLSHDGAKTWQQARVSPARGISLTAVSVVDDQTLVAVGHDGWIVRSTDQGQTWQEVNYEPELGEPLLGVWSGSDQHLYAFGSFGKFLHSQDGGVSWQAHEVNPDGYHINGLAGERDGTLMLVGEQGLVMRSLDAGNSWETLEPFYNGSLFGIAKLDAERWLAYGMRGHVFVSQDNGNSWQQVELDHEHPLYGHVILPQQKGVVLVGAGSTLVYLDAKGALLGNDQHVGAGTLTSAIALNQQLLFGGERGVAHGQNNRLAAGH